MSRRVALAVALTASACSFLVRGPDPEAPPAAPPDCSAWADAAWLADALAGTAMIGGHLVNLYVFNEEHEVGATDEPGHTAFGVATFGLAVTYLVAATVGAQKSARCFDATERHEAWKRQAAR